MECKKEKHCCSTKKGVTGGIIYGLIPHCGCFAFIILAVLGVTVTSSFLTPFLTNAYFFHGLIALSFVLSTISAFFYLRSRQSLSLVGIKKNWKYLLILYGTVIIVNILIFKIIFPFTANLYSSSNAVAGVSSTELVLEVEIPCSGHAFLVVNDVSKLEGVSEVKYTFPNTFSVYYDSEKISPEEITSAEIFKEFSVIN